MIRIRAAILLALGLLAAASVATFAQCGAENGGAGDGPAGAPETPAAAPPEAPPVLGERVRLLLSGSMNGRLEPCGCASGQSGGLARRMSLIQEMRNFDLLIEGGDLVEHGTPLDESKAATAVQVLFGNPAVTASLRGLPADSFLVGPYHALGVGPGDLELPLDRYFGGLVTAFQVPLVASDLQATAGEWPGVAFVEHEVRGTPVRIASLAMRLPAAIGMASPPPLDLLPPAAAWQRALQGAGPDTLRILLVHAAPERVRDLASLEPRPDLLVGIDGTYHEPPGVAEHRLGVPIVFPGIRGRIVLDVTLARTAAGSTLTRYDPIELRGSQTRPGAGEDPDVRMQLRQHREQVAEEDVLEALAGQLPVPNGQSYVGSAKCGECHPQDFQVWQNSRHGRAWQTLVEAEKDPTRYGWPVTQYPDCVSCHVVGYRHESGFVNAEQTPQLAGVGCERCHGAGSAHARDPAANKLGPVGGGTPSVVCTECHDFEQSPDFDYRFKWQVIEHGRW